ncbi:hypothetical protein AVEN_150958-1 [Araneus ventricosus]|uniref:Uncharacterized protein n=1 Tax=Araneus ventricosus TaxID=182803 RepID=A0A4Y2X264_ARAVE|nr:hypothetical protein AVEN_150958-1 [Araneus ventricosus]
MPAIVPGNYRMRLKRSKGSELQKSSRMNIANYQHLPSITLIELHWHMKGKQDVVKLECLLTIAPQRMHELRFMKWFDETNKKDCTSVMMFVMFVSST